MQSRFAPTRILYVLEEWALNPALGSGVRCLGVLRALRRMGRVDVAALGRPNGAYWNSAPESEGPIAYALETRVQPNEGLFAKLKWMLGPGTDYPHGCAVKPDEFRRLARDLHRYDLIWFFKLRAPELFPAVPWPRSVVDVDDVPSQYERAARRSGNPRERLLALRRLLAWRRREKLLGTRFSVLAVCSEQDRDYLSGIGVNVPIHVIPNGFERPACEPQRCLAKPPRIGFIGYFDYLPNRDGVSWFLKRCWPIIKREAPQARLRLVGRGSEQYREFDSSDVDRLGLLPDASAEIATWSAMVVPVRIGAGTRVKIAHGFSQKCPIVSTSLGAFGYGAVDGREMFVADSPREFAAACLRAICHPGEAAEMAERAWREFLERWTWDAIAPRVWEAAEDCLRKGGAARAAGASAAPTPCAPVRG